MSRQLLVVGVLIAASLAGSGCARQARWTRPVEPTDAPKVIELVAGVQLALAKNAPASWKCKLEGCAEAKKVCESAQDAEARVCTSTRDSADTGCADLAGPTAALRCTKLFEYAEAACSAASEDSNRICGAYRASQPPAIKRVALSLQTRVSRGGEIKLSVGLPKAALDVGGSSQKANTRSLNLEFMAVPTILVSEGADANSIATAEPEYSLTESISVRSLRQAITGQRTPLLGLQSRSGKKAFAFESAGAPVREPSDIAKQLSNVLLAAAAAASFEPLKDEKGESVPVAVTLRKMSYQYEIKWVSDAGGKISLTFVPVSFTGGLTSGVDAANLLELEIGR